MKLAKLALVFMALVVISVASTALGDEFPAHSFFDVFVEIQVGGGPFIGQWQEQQIPPSGNPMVEITNGTGMTETLSGAGFFISPTMIPLDDLNLNDIPPGSNGYPSLIPLPEYNGSMIQPGHSEAIGLPDEASTFALFFLAAIGLLACQRRLQPKYR
jgi:hypothetical protein